MPFQFDGSDKMFWAYIASASRVLDVAAHLVWAFLNTNFSAALFGALAGALAAHRIALRAERRKRLREEISGVNNAIALANTIANAFVGMKRQHVQEFAAMYKRDFNAYIAVLMNPPAVPTVYNFVVDYRALAMPLTPIVELRQTLLNRVQSSGAAISVSVVLHQSISNLASVISLREETFALLRGMNDADRIRAYFGLRTSEGNIDQRNSDQMTAIVSYVDDGIYFPMLIVELLVAHGNALSKAFGRGAPKVATIKYSKVAEAGLLPDPAEYGDFEQAYRSAKSPESLNRWQRLQAAVANFGILWGSPKG